MEAVAPVIARARGDFPVLGLEVNGRPLVYLDNAATSQKPRAVLQAMDDYYARRNGNIHRGVHHLSQAATDDYDRARERVARFIGAADPREIVFVRGATEGINLITNGLESELRPGDEIVLTIMEHHANIVPWQILAEKLNLKLHFAGLTEEGALDMEAWKACFNDRTRVASFTHISNVLGTINPVAGMVAFARE